MTTHRLYLITDLDDTALGGDYPVYARFPDEFSAMLDAFAVSGGGWGTNTSWDIPSQEQLLRNSSLKSFPRFLMGEFGRSLARFEAGQIQPDTTYCTARNREIGEFVQKKLVPVIKELCNNFPPETMNCYGHFFSYVPQEDTPRFREFCRRFFEDSELNCDFGKTFNIRPVFLDKGVPVSVLVENNELDKSGLIAAGDNIADIPMMEHAAYCVCPANAQDAVKKYVTERNGAVGEKPYGLGICDAVKDLAKRHKWNLGNILSRHTRE